ncbi:MAG: DeoR family transcriptional regulator, partial [Desulfobacteraceae bacterium]
MGRNLDNPAKQEKPQRSTSLSSPKATHGKNGLLKERQVKIQDIVHAKGFVTIEYLARKFKVTPQTIRRDINLLTEKGVINRYHGGAGVDSSIENVAYNERKVLCYKEKQKIAVT